MPSTPEKCGVSFILHDANDRSETYSRPFRVNINAEEALRSIHSQSPGLKGRVLIAKYDDGKFVESYDVD